jgi:hypothetical protein
MLLLGKCVVRGNVPRVALAFSFTFCVKCGQFFAAGLATSHTHSQPPPRDIHLMLASDTHWSHCVGTGTAVRWEPSSTDCSIVCQSEGGSVGGSCHREFAQGRGSL